jgi:hypothetical protein
MFIAVLGWGWVSRYEPLLEDLFTIAGKLEKLGFRYFKGKVNLLNPEELL